MWSSDTISRSRVNPNDVDPFNDVGATPQGLLTVIAAKKKDDDSGGPL